MPHCILTLGEGLCLHFLVVKMLPMTIAAVLKQVGLTKVATACAVTPSAVHKWKSQNRLPRTEWTGETRYAEKIAALHGGVTVAELLTRPNGG